MARNLRGRVRPQDGRGGGRGMRGGLKRNRNLDECDDGPGRGQGGGHGKGLNRRTLKLRRPLDY